MIAREKAERYVASYSRLVRRLGRIRDDFECSCALARCEELAKLDPPANSPEGGELIELATLVEEYERKNFADGKAQL